MMHVCVCARMKLFECAESRSDCSAIIYVAYLLMLAVVCVALLHDGVSKALTEADPGMARPLRMCPNV